jgi:hypothetical protein
MPDEQKPQWLARLRMRREVKRHRTGNTRWWWNTGTDVDSEEKIAEGHTRRGRELGEEDRRYRTKGGFG